ncbi:hypothetical protein PTTG_10013, partial [Puccinia triticina 1-1 BBBD Race 1]
RFQDVLDGFRDGFDQGIPEHRLSKDLPYFTPPNHTSALMAKDKIEASIRKELEAGRMFGPFTYDQVQQRYSFFRTNPLGAVINGDGSLRPINDLSFPRGETGIPSVNSFVDASEFKTSWDDFNAVANFLKEQKEPVLLALFDWEKAYRQIPTAPAQWPYLMVRDFDDRLLLDTRITFGGVAGCGSFGRPADAWKELMMAEFDVLNVFRWVDDNLFVKRPSSGTLMADIVKRSDELGVKTNKEKYSPFLEEQKYVGFVWNGTDKTVRLPEAKLTKRINQIRSFLEIGATFAYNDVEVIAGRLNHVAYILPQLRCYLCGLYRWLMNWVHRETARPLPPDAEEDLHMWLTTLSNFKPTRLIARQEPTEVGWVGDASTGFGIGVLIGKRWAQFRLQSMAELDKNIDEEKREEERIARLETIAVRLGLMMLIKLGARGGKTFIVWTNNTTTESVITKRKSKDRFVNAEWKKIQATLIENQINLVAKRVTSAENRADELSRGIRRNHRTRYQLRVGVPHDLEELIEQV